jgi:hypothetical protein
MKLELIIGDYSLEINSKAFWIYQFKDYGKDDRGYPNFLITMPHLYFCVSDI